jgi:large subunit ribosomal protein L10
MNRNEKSQAVDQLRERFSKATSAIVTEYRGMKVLDLWSLRKKVREGNGELKVVKNRLAKIALKGTAYETLVNDFKGPLAIAFSYKDAVPVAKAVSESLSDTSPLKIKVASLNGRSIGQADVIALSKLPSREVLLAMLLGTLQAPMRNLATVLSAVPRDFVNAITDLKNKKEKQG